MISRVEQSILISPIGEQSSDLIAAVAGEIKRVFGYAAETGSLYLGTSVGLRPTLSPETEATIDREIRRLVEEAQDQALSLLGTHKAALEEIAAVLQTQEVISGEEIERIARDHMKAEGEAA